MKTGWTGGQYSIYRALLAIELAALITSRVISTSPSISVASMLGLGFLACIALGIGLRDRMAALYLLLLLGFLIAFLDGAPLVLPGTDVVLGGILLLAHCAVPSLPFGAWDARGRPDPAGDWQMPRWIVHIAWALLALIYLTLGLDRLSGVVFRPTEIDLGVLASIAVVIDLVFAVAVIRTRWRPAAWIAMSLWRLAWLAAFGPGVVEFQLWLLQLLTFDPAWIPGRSKIVSSESADGPAQLFYDGDCGLCHRSIRFVLAEEGASPDRLRLRFAPLESDAFRRWSAGLALPEAEPLPDSIVLLLEDGSHRTRSAAALEIASRLGGIWRALAWAGGLLPAAPLDRAYDALARIRKKIFAQPKGSCPILPPELRLRFDL
jgi:predicted DCC family thiol-disulfide oxidoreductase YuxK